MGWPGYILLRQQELRIRNNGGKTTIVGNKYTYVSFFAVLSHSISNCHLSRTSVVSLLEITTTSLWTRHSKSHSKKSKKLVAWILHIRNCQIHGHLICHSCINQQTRAYLTNQGLVCQVAEKIQNTTQDILIYPLV